MKKVLTLMGALSVAGSALAHDYLWNMSDLSEKEWSEGFTVGALNYAGDSNSSYDEVKKGVVSSVKGSDQNNRFKFTVEAGDIVTVHAITVSNNTGKVYLKQNGLETNADIDNSGSTVLTVSTNESAGGDVFVYADANVVITKIVVVSAKYNEVVAKIADARTAVDQAKSDRLASLVSQYPDFYTAITRQISLKVSNQIIAIEKKLAEDAAENNVSQLAAGTGTGDGLIAQLDALVNPTTGVLKDIEVAAAAAKTAYETTFKTGTDYTTAKAAIDLAYKQRPTVAESDGYTIETWTKKNGSGAATAWADKADGLRTYMDNVAKKLYNEALVDAEKELANFPWTDDQGIDHTYPVATYNTKMQTTVTYIHNIIDRFVYEKAHKSEYSTLKSNVELTEGHITAAGLTKPTTPVDFDALKTGVTDLYNLLNKADNKETYNKAQIDNPGNIFKQVLEGYQTQYSGVQTTLTNEAKGKKNALCEATQNNLNEYSGKITELYTGQPETQKVYEQKFAELQVRLNAIKAYSTYAELVSGYGNVVAKLQEIDTEILNIWGESQGAKIQEIIAQNTTKYNTLTEDISKALDDYAKMVNRINGYKTIPGIETDQNAIAEINKQLANVFEYAYDIETTKTNAATAYDKVKDGSASFDYDTFKNEVDNALALITTATEAARGEANTAAHTYLTDNRYINTKGTLTYANKVLTEAYNKYNTGSKKDSDLAAGAKDKISGTGGLTATYYTPALNKVNNHWNSLDPMDCDIADYVNEIANDLNPIYGKLTEIDNQVDAYDASDAKITQLKIDWSIAKANVDADYTAKLIPMLNTINENITALKTTLSGYGFAAGEHKTEIDKEVARLNDELWKVNNYKTYLANEASLVTINDAIKKVKIDEINAAKAEVQKLVTEEVKTEYIAKLEAISFTNVEATRDAHYASHDLNDAVVQSAIQADLAAISAQIAQLVADAQAADKAAQEVPGDVNGDKSVDAADYEAIEYFAVAGDDAELTDEEKALRAKADLNGDGTVNLSDLSEFVKLYQSKDAE